MRMYKNITAVALALSMIAGSGVTAFAASSDTGKLSGAGTVEGVVDKSVFSVILPTAAVGDTTFDFVLDPEGLIAATGAAAHGGDDTKYEAGASLFFANLDPAAPTDATKTKYSSKSDKLQITNKSSIPVTVTLNATVTAPSGITMATDKTFASDTGTSLYLALSDDTNEAPISESGGVLTAELAAAADGAYEIVWDATDSAYKYKLKSGATATDFVDFDFSLTGACNTTGDWSALKDANPTVDVVWTVAEKLSEAAPSITTTTYAMTPGTDVDVTLSLGGGSLAATGISSIKYRNSSNVSTTLPASNYSLTGNTLKILSSYTDALTASRKFTVIFNDAAKTEVEITLTK